MSAEPINNDLGDSSKDPVIRREEKKYKNICIFCSFVQPPQPRKLAELPPDQVGWCEWFRGSSLER